MSIRKLAEEEEEEEAEEEAEEEELWFMLPVEERHKSPT